VVFRENKFAILFKADKPTHPPLFIIQAEFIRESHGEGCAKKSFEKKKNDIKFRFAEVLVV
jgi:hypothetical protein